MKRIDKEIWEPSDGIILEKSAKQSITSQNNILVIAGPGAGKTELLAQKATYLLQTNLCKDPQKILAISFKTDAAQNLKERVERRCGQDAKSRFSSMTYDAFFKRILDHFLYALPEELRPNTDYLINDLKIIDQAFIHQDVFLDGTVNSKFNKHYDKTLKETILPLNTNDFGS
jgi:superfamily I DNA/RNA helicase